MSRKMIIVVLVVASTLAVGCGYITFKASDVILQDLSNQIEDKNDQNKQMYGSFHSKSSEERY